jgi:hypothetical protein
MSSVKDMSVEDFRKLVGDVVEEKLQDLLFDPGKGLFLRPGIRMRLLQSLNQRESRQTITAEEVARRIGLE